MTEDALVAPLAARAEIIAAADFRSALRRFLRSNEEAALRAGLTLQRYQLLLMIKASLNEEATVSQLSRRLYLPQTTATELVSRAFGAGLIERRSSSRDRRVVFLRLTPEGDRRLMAVFSALRAERAQFARAFREVDQTFRELVRAGET